MREQAGLFWETGPVPRAGMTEEVLSMGPLMVKFKFFTVLCTCNSDSLHQPCGWIVLCRGRDGVMRDVGHEVTHLGKEPYVPEKSANRESGILLKQEIKATVNRRNRITLRIFLEILGVMLGSLAHKMKIIDVLLLWLRTV